MNASTIAKVDFFGYVISAALRGKLKTAGKGFLNQVDRLLESRHARLLAFIGAVIGCLATVYQIYLWIAAAGH